jgi:nicotinic acid mononucleotide adenylyltransferase
MMPSIFHEIIMVSTWKKVGPLLKKKKNKLKSMYQRIHMWKVLVENGNSCGDENVKSLRKQQQTTDKFLSEKLT